MDTSLNIGLSGLYADSLRINASTNNIANQFTTGNASGKGGYMPQDIVQTSNQNGGVQAHTINRSPASVQSYQPYSPVANSKGMVSTPNVDTIKEMGSLMKASSHFSMLTSVVSSEAKRTGQLVNILA